MLHVVRPWSRALALVSERSTDLDEAARRWAARGPALVVLTDGGAQVRIARPGGPVLRREIPRVDDVDTVAGVLGRITVPTLVVASALGDDTDLSVPQRLAGERLGAMENGQTALRGHGGRS